MVKLAPVWLQGFVLALAAAAGGVSVYRRSIGGLNSMATCLANLTVLQTVQYASYGCFCGVGSAGNRPVDGTDRCCQLHDDCYDTAVTPAVGCSKLDMYLMPYNYTRKIDASGECRVHCKLLQDYPSPARRAKCKAFLCQCDQTMANCLVKERQTFSHKFVGHRYRSAYNCIWIPT